MEEGLDVAHRDGCAKMSLCGAVEQTKLVKFRAVDNKKRDDAVVEVKMHLAKATTSIPVTKVGDYSYDITWVENTIGVGIMEIYVNGEQIPQSPIRVQVDDRQCDLDYPGEKRQTTREEAASAVAGRSISVAVALNQQSLR